jgi:hypothetical protein
VEAAAAAPVAVWVVAAWAAVLAKAVAVWVVAAWAAVLGKAGEAWGAGTARQAAVAVGWAGAAWEGTAMAAAGALAMVEAVTLGERAGVTLLGCNPQWRSPPR